MDIVTAQTNRRPRKYENTNVKWSRALPSPGPKLRDISLLASEPISLFDHFREPTDSELALTAFYFSLCVCSAFDEIFIYFFGLVFRFIISFGFWQWKIWRKGPNGEVWNAIRNWTVANTGTCALELAFRYLSIQFRQMVPESTTNSPLDDSHCIISPAVEIFKFSSKTWIEWNRR